MNTLGKILRSKIFIAAAALILIYTLAGFFLAPYLVRRHLPLKIREHLHKAAEVGKVAFNPYLFTLELRSFRMSELDGQPLVAFERLYVDFELKSLFRRAWIFGEIQLEGPVIHAVMRKKGGLNLADLAPFSSAGQPEEKRQPARLIFEKVRIVHGQLTFTDRRPQEPATITLAPLDIGIVNLATLPERQGDTALTATGSNGETLRWRGQVGLNPLVAKGHISVHHVPSATLAAFVGDRLRLAPPAGFLAVETDCALDFGKAAAQVEFPNFSLHLSGMALALPEAAAPFLELPEARISGARLDLTGRKVDLGALSVQGGTARLAMNPQGELNLLRIVAPSAGGFEQAAEPAADKPPAKPWTFRLGGFEISRFTAAYEDMRRAPGFKADVGDLQGRFAAVARTGERFSALVSDLALRVRQARAGFGEAAPEIQIGSLALENGTLDLAQKRLQAGLIALEGGEVRAERRSDGTFNLAQLIDRLGPAPDGAPGRQPGAAQVKQPQAGAADRHPGAAPQAVEPGETSGFKYRVDRIALSGMQVELWDKTVRADQPILNVDALSAAAAQVDGRSSMPVELSLRVRQGGRIKAAGMLDPAGLSLTAKVEVAALALASFQPYVEPFAAIVIKGGSFSSTGDLRHGFKPAEAHTLYQGQFKCEKLQITETDSAETVLGWRSLHSEQFKLLLQPHAVEIGDLRVQDVAGKAIIEEDSSFNLANLIKPAEPGRSDPGQKDAPFSFRIRRLLVTDGRIAFADRRLPVPFATNIHELRGTVAGISSVPNARSQLRLRGRVDEFGTARAEGELNPSDPKRFTDLKLAFRNVEMSSLTPYSGKFAGRAIDAGKLSVDLAYEVNRGQLAGDNQIVVEQLRLGDKVESPDAVDLPLDLAVALLKDSQGVIKLGLPVKGDLNNPQFSLGGLFGKALVNLIKKIATSPFRAIGALIPGRDEQTLDSVTFEPGRAAVPPPEKEKLLQLAHAMRQRPQVKLLVQGRYHPDLDRRALARRSLRRTVTERLGQDLPADEIPGPLDFGSSETREVLEEMFGDRFGREALAAFREAAKKAAREEKSTDAGALAKGLFARLLEVEPVPGDRLVELARARGDAVITEIQAGGLSAERFGTREPAALEESAPISAALSLEARQ